MKSNRNLIARRKFGDFVWSLHSHTKITNKIRRASLTRDRNTQKGWHIAQGARLLFYPRCYSKEEMITPGRFYPGNGSMMGQPMGYAPKAVIAWATRQLMNKWGK